MRVLFVSTYLAQEPLGLMHLSAALKAAGHETKLLFVPDPAFPAKLRAYDPGVVCFSFTTGVHQAMAGLERLVRRLAPRVVTLAGGPHVTVVPDFLEESGFPPTHAEIARGLGYRSANAAAEHVRLLARKGWLTIEAGAARGIRLVASPSEADERSLPLVGQVAEDLHEASRGDGRIDGPLHQESGDVGDRRRRQLWYHIRDA